MLSFSFLVWVRMTFACIIPAMFLSEFELAPKIVITSLFYLNRLWALAFICRHLLNNLYCIFLLSKASILLHQLIPDQPSSGPGHSTPTMAPTSHFWPPTGFHSLISWQILPAFAQQPPRDYSQPVVEQDPSSLPSVTKPHPWPSS